MAHETNKSEAVLLDGDMVQFRNTRVRERMVTVSEGPKYPLEEFQERWPHVEIKGLTEPAGKGLLETPIANLKQALSEVKDPAVIKKAMRNDERVTSTQYYIARLEELGGHASDAGTADGDSESSS